MASLVLEELGRLRRCAEERLADRELRLVRSRLAEESGVSVKTISDWFNHKHEPRNLDHLLAVARILARWAELPPPVPRKWSALMAADRTPEAQSEVRTPPAQPAVPGIADYPGHPVPGPDDRAAPGRPVTELADPFSLEVHRAIDVPPATGSLGAGRGEALPLLPAYVERGHDARLRETVQQGANGVSGIVVLVGGSSCGKTRACWEAVQTLPAAWRLWHPIAPDRPQALLAGLAAVSPRTVVWLNEMQHYLLTPTDSVGERVAAGLRDLLTEPDRAPVLVLGTMWPEYWAAVADTPQPGVPDAHPQARVLLSGAVVPVPDTFNAPALKALKDTAAGDPRLARAVAEAEQGQITQYLAGAPSLLDRYRAAPTASRALIETAMDARRLGHGRALPLALLETAAPGYLTDGQWDTLGEDWLEQALAYTAAPCHGARGPLTRIRPRPGDPYPAQPHYVLADYLEQEGRTNRRTVGVPPQLWHALVEHAAVGSHVDIARAAHLRGFKRLAVHAYARAAAHGDTFALLQAAKVLRESGRTAEAIDWYQRAAEAGDSFALHQTTALLREAGRTDEAIGWFRRAAETGDTEALQQTLDLLSEAGRREDALGWLRQRAEAGDIEAMRRLAYELQTTGDPEDALSWYRRAAEAGDIDAMRRAAGLLQVMGAEGESLTWFRRAAETGDTYALQQTIELLLDGGRREEAVRWLRTRVKTDDAFAFERMVDLLWAAGRTDDALDALRARARSGHESALLRAVSLLSESGRVDEAVQWLTEQAATGGAGIRRPLVDLLLEAGRGEEAIAWLRGWAETGDTGARRRAVDLLLEGGRAEEAVA
ncbi:hypothetical protein, partial [Streptomyces chartreusis]